MSDPPSRRPSPILFASVGILFFLSGFSGLVYQVLWMRELGLLFGNTAHAAATTAAVFFLGLGTGSAFFGERSRRLGDPLKAYGYLELAVSGAALLFFGLSGAYRAIYPGLFETFGNRPALFVVVKFLLAATILFPPAFFMGGTLPVIARFLTRNFDPSALGRRVPIFYGINTLGAGAGTLAAGFFLPRWIGMTNSYWLAIGITTAAGMVAVLIARSQGVEPTNDSKGPSRAKLSLPRSISSLAFFSGFTTLALEVLWTRMFAQTLHNSVYTYATILVTFLVALAVGSWIASALAKRFPERSSAVLPWLLLVAGALTLASPTLYHAFGSDRGGYLGSSENWPAYLRLVFLSAGITIFPATVALGVIFPFLLKLSEEYSNEASASRIVGRLTAINTGGAVLGSLAAGFVLLDLFGLWSSIRLFAAGTLILVFFVDRRPAKSSKESSGGIPEASVLAAMTLLLGLTLVDPTRLPTVRYEPVKKDETLLRVREGGGATVAVVRSGDSLRIKVNNFYALGSTDSAGNERFQAHLPLVVHPEPKTVFFLGLGTGITAGGALQVDGVERVTVAELLPEVVKASRDFFGPWLNGLFEDSRVRVVAEDGRNFLAGTRESYDVIVSDLFIPWRSGVGSLYTVEHYANSRERLAPGGIYAQWLPLYQLTEAEFASIAHSMREVFPHLTVWRGDFFADKPIVCLIGAAEPQTLDWSIFEGRSIALNKKAGINQLGPMENLPGHMTYYTGNFSAAANLYADARLNTDDYPHIEYDAPVSHRAERAGEVGRFVGRPLIDFFGALRSQVPPDRDPWLEFVPPKGRRLVDVGYVLHQIKVAQAEKDKAEEERLYQEFEEILRDL